MKNFIGFVFGIITTIIGLITSIIGLIIFIHKKGLQNDSDYKTAHKKHADTFSDAVANYIDTLIEDFAGMFTGKTYYPGVDKWRQYNQYTMTIITFVDIFTADEANRIGNIIKDNSYKFYWHKYGHADKVYSISCYNEDRRAIEDILTNNNVRFVEAHYDDEKESD